MHLRTESLIYDYDHYHSNHLGSASYITDLDGQLVQHIEYNPFGEVFLEERNNHWNTPYLFNSKELDEETGLYYYGARYYDARVSQWLSVDPPMIDGRYFPDDSEDVPLAGGVFESKNLSVYGYVHHNPVKLIDPSGNNPVIVIGGVLLTISDVVLITTGVITSGVILNQKNSDSYNRLSKEARDALTSAVTGTVELIREKLEKSGSYTIIFESGKKISWKGKFC